jgi:hypothetical protein
MRKLAHHEQKLLKKVDFLSWKSDANLRELDHVLSNTFTFYGPDAIMSPFFGNHDLPRFISTAAGDRTDDGWSAPPGPPNSDLPYSKLKLAFTLLFTIPGAPMFYYGDEIGMPGAADPDNRRMMRFTGLSSREQGVLDHVRKLGPARRGDDALRHGDYMTIWVDDAGRVISPQLAEGQLLGGLAQGIGQALMERIVYDELGQLLTGSLMDYALPRAGDIPAVELESLATPASANILGAKGVGEAGTIGVPAAILNAAIDALAPLGVTELDFPLTAERLWRTIHASHKEQAA